MPTHKQSLQGKSEGIIEQLRSCQDPSELRTLAEELAEKYSDSNFRQMLELAANNKADALEFPDRPPRPTLETLVARLIQEFSYSPEAAIAGATWLRMIFGEAGKAFMFWWEEGGVSTQTIHGVSAYDLVSRFGYNPATAIIVLDEIERNGELDFPPAYGEEDLFVQAGKAGFGRE